MDPVVARARPTGELKNSGGRIARGAIRIPLQAPLERIWVGKEKRWVGIEELAGEE